MGASEVRSSQPPLSFQEFAAEVSALGQDVGGSIALAGIPWMSVARVTLELYVRRSGHLTVDHNCAVVGVSTFFLVIAKC